MFNSLAHPKLLLKEKSSDQWYLGMGSTCSTLAQCWPAVGDQCGAREIWRPLVSREAKVEFLAILDPADWEAVPLEVWGPLRQAIERHAPGNPASDVVQLPASGHFGKLAIGAVALGPTHPLLEVSADECFWLLPLCVLRKLAHHLSEEYTKIGLVGTCVFLIHVINDCTTKD